MGDNEYVAWSVISGVIFVFMMIIECPRAAWTFGLVSVCSCITATLCFGSIAKVEEMRGPRFEEIMRAKSFGSDHPFRGVKSITITFANGDSTTTVVGKRRLVYSVEGEGM